MILEIPFVKITIMMEEDESTSSLKGAGPSPLPTDSRADNQSDSHFGTDSALSMGYKSVDEDLEDRIRRDGHDPNSMTDGGKIAFLVEQLQVKEKKKKSCCFHNSFSWLMSVILDLYRPLN